MKKSLLILVFLLNLGLNAQQSSHLKQNTKRLQERGCATPTPGDLVINGDFEQYSSLPTSISQITKACGWASPTIGTPDYLHRNSTSNLVSIPVNNKGTEEVNPLYGGDAYAGIVFSGGVREMMRTQLAEPLQSNTDYILRLDVSLADNRAGNQIMFQAFLGDFIDVNVGGELPTQNDPNGILLTNNTFSTTTNGWDTITFTFSTGDDAGQDHLYIGTIDNVVTANNFIGYYFIDNISLIDSNNIPCEDCNDLADTIINSLLPDSDCDSFNLTIPHNTFECYDVVFNSGEPGTGNINLNDEILINGLYTFNYEDNGFYTPRIILFDQETGKQCAFKRKSIRVNCCNNCNEVGGEILQSIVETQECGFYKLRIPPGALECYQVIFNSGIIGSDDIELTEQLLINGVFIFNYTENNQYSASIRMFTIDSGKECFFDKVSLDVDCFLDPNCGWPKTIGTDNPNNPDLYHSEYVSDLIEDNNGDLLALGRAQIGAVISNYTTTEECYLVKYDSEGCPISVKNIPFIKYPLQMEVLNNNDLIVLSTQDRPYFGENELYVDRLDSDGNLIWRSEIDISYFQPHRNTRFVLDKTNNDIYLNLPRNLGSVIGSPNYAATLTDNDGLVFSFSNSTIIRLNESGSHIWSEQISQTTFSNEYPTTQDLDIINNTLIVTFTGRENRTYLLETSGVNITVGPNNDPNSHYKQSVVVYNVNSNSSITYNSFFETHLNPSSINRIAINGNYVYMSETRSSGDSFVNIYNYLGSLITDIGFDHRVDSFEHIKNSTDIMFHGSRSAFNSGFGITKIDNLNIVWNEDFSTTGSNISTWDIEVTSDNKVFVTGSYNGNIDIEPNLTPIGGYDGFIMRFLEENGTLVSGLINNNAIQIQRNKQQFDYNLFPNPSKGYVTINALENHETEQISIRIFDFSGNEVYTNTTSIIDTIELDINTIKNGFYFIEIRKTDTTTELHKLVVNK